MKPAQELINIIDNVYGTYFDATYGFYLQMKDLEDSQNKEIDNLPTEKEKLAKIHELDSKPLTYAINGFAGFEHQISIENYKSRNWPNGTNDQWAAKMLIVTIYSLWEVRYRELIAIDSGLTEANKLKSTVFGELGYYRNAILHKLGIATEDFKKVITFNWFKYNEKIVLDVEKISFIVRTLKAELEKYL
jgi:hypothetical protein